MAETRQRIKIREPNGSATSQHNEQPTTPTSAKAAVDSLNNRLSVTDVLRIVAGLLLLNSALSYFVTNDSIAWGWRPWFSKPENVRSWLVSALITSQLLKHLYSSATLVASTIPPHHVSVHQLTLLLQAGPVRLTDTQLLAYDGSDASKPIYVALNGSIYDVTPGRHFYGPDGSYSFFAGRDAARAFVTGCFDTDLTPDLRGVEEMFLPLDAAVGAGAEGLSRADVEARGKREYEAARKKVTDTIEGWASMFRGEGGKPYLKVGEVVREPGWLEKLPVPELCDRAQKMRKPRRT